MVTVTSAVGSVFSFTVYVLLLPSSTPTVGYVIKTPAPGGSATVICVSPTIVWSTRFEASYCPCNGVDPRHIRGGEGIRIALPNLQAGEHRKPWPAPAQTGEPGPTQRNEPLFSGVKVGPGEPRVQRFLEYREPRARAIYERYRNSAARSHSWGIDCPPDDWHGAGNVYAVRLSVVVPSSAVTTTLNQAWFGPRPEGALRRSFDRTPT